MIGRRPSCHRVAEHCAADDPCTQCTVYSYYHTKLCSIHQSWARDNCIALRQRQRADVICRASGTRKVVFTNVKVSVSKSHNEYSNNEITNTGVARKKVTVSRQGCCVPSSSMHIRLPLPGHGQHGWSGRSTGATGAVLRLL